MTLFITLGITLLVFGLFVLLLIARKDAIQVDIDKGDHYASPYVTLLQALKVGCTGRRIFWVTFHANSANYTDWDEDEDDYDGAWNKALGRTHGFLETPRGGSTRLWWRRSKTPGMIEYAIVEEQDSKFANPAHNRTFFSTAPGVPVRFEIRHRGWPCVAYFGGKFEAPDPVSLTIR